MTPLKVLGASTAQPGLAAPVRMAFFYFPNGAWTDSWVPKAAGADYELPFSLAPLEKAKDDKAASHEGDGHYAKTANFLTGEHVNKTTGKDISAGGISVDQLAAQKSGDTTPLPSLELGIDPVVSGIDSNVGYTRLYASYISWRGPGVPVAREISPRAVFDRLFGPKDAQGRPTTSTRADDRRLLDLALEDATDLRKRLGRDDQLKVDEYLDAVRAVEKRVEFASKANKTGWKPTSAPNDVARPGADIPHDYQEHVRLMMDMLVLAFWTDSTRIASFMFANDVSGRNFTGIVDGVHGGHHHISHHENDAAKIEQYRLINRWHVQQFAQVLEKLRAIKEGEIGASGQSHSKSVNWLVLPA